MRQIGDVCQFQLAFPIWGDPAGDVQMPPRTQVAAAGSGFDMAAVGPIPGTALRRRSRCHLVEPGGQRGAGWGPCGRKVLNSSSGQFSLAAVIANRCLVGVRAAAGIGFAGARHDDRLRHHRGPTYAYRPTTVIVILNCRGATSAVADDEPVLRIR